MGQTSTACKMDDIDDMTIHDPSSQAAWAMTSHWYYLGVLTWIGLAEIHLVACGRQLINKVKILSKTLQDAPPRRPCRGFLALCSMGCCHAPGEVAHLRRGLVWALQLMSNMFRKKKGWMIGMDSVL